MCLLLKHHTYLKQEVCYSYRVGNKGLDILYDSKHKAVTAFICRDIRCEWSILASVCNKPLFSMCFIFCKWCEFILSAHACSGEASLFQLALKALRQVFLYRIYSIYAGYAHICM